MKCEEEVMNISVSAASLDLSKHVGALLPLQKCTMLSFHSVYNVYSHTLVGENKFGHGDSICDSVHYVLAHIHYDASCVRNDNNSSHG